MTNLFFLPPPENMYLREMYIVIYWFNRGAVLETIYHIIMINI